jgi:hypothetical protein
MSSFDQAEYLAIAFHQSVLNFSLRLKKIIYSVQCADEHT